MKNTPKRLITFIIALIFALSLPICVYANSAEPPVLMVVVHFPPENVEVDIMLANGIIVSGHRAESTFACVFRFWRYELENGININSKLIVTTDEKTFECAMPESVNTTYNNVLTLNLEDETLKDGVTILRTVLLVIMRIAFTLVIEGLVFFLFGYRQKRSWGIFLATNLITQGALNIILSNPFMGSYWILGYMLLENVIFLAEIVVFVILINEGKKWKAPVSSLVANFFSLFIGGYLIAKFMLYV